EALVAAWLARVRSVARAQLGERPEADDAVQEAFVLAWRRLGQLADPVAFGPWLLAIARNAAMGQGRRLARDRTVALTGPDPESRRDGDGPDLGLARALARLSPDQREIIRLKYECGLGYAEIAETLGLGLAAVEKRLWRARQALLAALKA
ncbi:MAG: hypothetical protein RLZZ127_3215, partial [Planctomycetota bacterium]